MIQLITEALLATTAGTCLHSQEIFHKLPEGGGNSDLQEPIDFRRLSREHPNALDALIQTNPEKVRC